MSFQLNVLRRYWIVYSFMAKWLSSFICNMVNSGTYGVVWSIRIRDELVMCVGSYMCNLMTSSYCFRMSEMLSGWNLCLKWPWVKALLWWFPVWTYGKNWTSAVDSRGGRRKCIFNWTFSGTREVPCAFTIYPRNYTWEATSTHFSGLTSIPKSISRSNNCVSLDIYSTVLEQSLRISSR